MTIKLLIKALRNHPDKDKPQSEPQSNRAHGFTGLRINANGSVRVEWHWGTRSFATIEELEGWLNGVVPLSWQI